MKHPKRLPQWYQDFKKKKEASSSSVDNVLASVEDGNVDQDCCQACL